MVSLEEMRKQYTIDELNRDQLLENPTDMFRKWFEEVEALDDIEPNAMALATASDKGKPSNRIRTAQEYDEKGFIFYTNESEKGNQIENNPYASLNLHWPKLERHWIRGKIRKVSREKSENIFKVDPVESNSVLASNQSKILAIERSLRTL